MLYSQLCLWFSKSVSIGFCTANVFAVFFGHRSLVYQGRKLLKFDVALQLNALKMMFKSADVPGSPMFSCSLVNTFFFLSSYFLV